MPQAQGLLGQSKQDDSQAGANPDKRLMELSFKGATGSGLTDQEKLEQEALRRRQKIANYSEEPE